ncbi:MAG: SPOR domain-containing protein [Flavobacteriales bacterium]|nr:SPOR domain-containing protein [Flavobacteriales bacterium]MBL6872870.1 SPOR domain-containing protein [Flavobacteriales bacterium]
MKALYFLCFCLVSSTILSQNTSIDDRNESRIDNLVSKQIQINSLKKGIDGFRVQIHHDKSQSREESQKVRANFSQDFPELKTYLEFKSPYYKIQVGDFITRIEAYKVQKEISKKYRGTYIVPSIVNFELDLELQD